MSYRSYWSYFAYFTYCFAYLKWRVHIGHICHIEHIGHMEHILHISHICYASHCCASNFFGLCQDTNFPATWKSFLCNLMIQQSVDDLQPQNRPPILQQPPALAALPPFDFPAIVRRSGGNTTALLASIREAEAYLEMLHDIVMLSM